jgi:uncharacterized protein (TIGR02421 family)
MGLLVCSLENGDVAICRGQIEMNEKMGKTTEENGGCRRIAFNSVSPQDLDETKREHARFKRQLSRTQSAIRTLSDRLVEAQRPIRILDTIKWDEEIEHAFFASGCRSLPPVNRDYYRARPLCFDVEEKRQEFLLLERDIRQRLGKHNAAGQIMTRMAEEYRQVLDLLSHRGTAAFALLSKRLYGSASVGSPDGEPDLAELGRQVGQSLKRLSQDAFRTPVETTLSALQAVRILSKRLSGFFEKSSAVRVRLSDGIVADAAAGSDYIKLRANSRFTLREIRLLEVHEGWVHLATTLNGQHQPICTFLSKGPPSSTVTQEGLAVLTEILAFASFPDRIRRLTHRVEAIARAEAGADFLDVFRFFRDERYRPRESYQHTVRIFRGSLPAGCGPFTKDLCYSRGLVLLYGFMRQAVKHGQMHRLPLLFCGKTNFADIKTLALLADEGLLAPPRYLPPPFANLQALAAWLCYANLFTSLSQKQVEDAIARIF